MNTKDKNQKKDAFLCHASLDTEALRLIVRELQVRGVSIWFDECELTPGDSLLTTIEAAIEQTKCFLVAVSKNSLESRWVKHELAQSLTLELQGKGPRVIPVLLDKTSEIPTKIADRLYVDLSDTQTLPKSLDALASAIATANETTPAPYVEALESTIRSTTLSDADTQACLYLCTTILDYARLILKTWRRAHNSEANTTRLRDLRVLLFFVYPQYKCLQLKVYVNHYQLVVDCKHRFTTDRKLQEYLSLAAQAWNSKQPTWFSYSVEFDENKEQYLKESEEFGFDLKKIAHIRSHISSALALPFSILRLRDSSLSIPAVICIDSEHKGVFDEQSVTLINESIGDFVLEFNTGRKLPFETSHDEWTIDNRGMIDECKPLYK